jgi:predicted amidohydrolase YtcJ
MGGDAEAPRAARTYDGQGLYLLPGFIDSHAHMLWLALDRLVLNLARPEGPRSIGELQALLRAQPARPGTWLVANGLSEAVLAEKRLPTRSELDAVSTEVPIALRRVCGHAAVVNSAALRLTGLGDDAPDPSGGVIEREGGVPNGILRERAAALVYPRLPMPALAEVRSSLAEVAIECLGLGITTVVEAAVGFSHGFEKEWEAWTYARSKAPLPVRLAFMLGIPAEEARLRGIVPGPADEDWQVATLKFFSDGTLGSRTAALHLPYCNCGGRTGLLMDAPGRLRHQVRSAAGAGWQVAIHAIGDRGVDEALAALEGVSARPEMPHRIEHLGLAGEATCERIRRLGAAVVTQPSFIALMGDAFAAALGPERSGDLYRMATPMRQGVLVAGSSDAPAGALAPLASMADARERLTRGGAVLGASERLDAAQALALYTANAARVIGQPGKGRLAPGCAGDALLLDVDPFNCSAAKLRSAAVRATFVRGALCWES